MLTSLKQGGIERLKSANKVLRNESYITQYGFSGYNMGKNKTRRWDLLSRVAFFIKSKIRVLLFKLSLKYFRLIRAPPVFS